jgi:flagellar L-ring protein precursor FlgH
MKALRIFASSHCVFLISVVVVPKAYADDLFRGHSFASMAADRIASNVGDGLVIVVLQNAEARNSAANSTDFRYGLQGSVNSGSTDEGIDLSFSRDRAKKGEVRRSQSFITQLAVTVVSVLENGDLIVAGTQQVRVNGQQTAIRVSGRVRPADIRSDNRVLSTQVADASIDFDVGDEIARNARQPLIARAMSWFKGRL